MPLHISSLQEASRRPIRTAAASLQEARNMRMKTAFLSHSHKDADLAKGFVALLLESGWRIYVDWADTTMPERPNRETAARLQGRIKECDFFLFLATANSMGSKWCPWEIGYADGTKPIDSIIVCPTTEGYTTHGSEYLDLYRRIDLSSAGKLAVWRPGNTQNGVLVESL